MRIKHLHSDMLDVFLYTNIKLNIFDKKQKERDFIIKDFKEFAFKGNVLDLAIAVVIGAAFGKIVTSLVENVITPLLGALLQGMSFEQLVSPPIRGVEIPYGLFIQSIFDFFIIAASIFLFVRLLMKLKRKEEIEEEAPAEVDIQEQLLTEIRDLLKEKNKGR